MSLTPCTTCGQRESKNVKLTQITWAWWNGNNERVAYRQRLCRACFLQRVAQLYVKNQDEALVCPQCGISTVDDMDPVYATFYPSGVGKLTMELPTCASCAARIRIGAQENAERLENRDPSGSGSDPGPSPTVSEILRGLGIEVGGEVG